MLKRDSDYLPYRSTVFSTTFLVFFGLTTLVVLTTTFEGLLVRIMFGSDTVTAVGVVVTLVVSVVLPRTSVEVVTVVCSTTFYATTGVTIAGLTTSDVTIF